jgi:hypothetical protein
LSKTSRRLNAPASRRSTIGDGLSGAVIVVGLLTLGFVAPGVDPAAAGGVTSGGGVRSNGSVRLSDVLGPFAAGRLEGDGLVIESGLVVFVLEAVPVRLVSLTIAAENGSPRLAWELTADSDPIGFHVDRSSRADGGFERLTPSLLSGATREFTDVSPAGGVTWWYLLTGVARDGREIVLGVVPYQPAAPPLAVRLYPAFPNPAVSGATFAIDLPAESPVRLTLFDISGRQVAALFDGRLPAGRHHLGWDGGGAAGPLAAGMYFARLETPEVVQTMKVTVRGR